MIPAEFGCSGANAAFVTVPGQSLQPTAAHAIASGDNSLRERPKHSADRQKPSALPTALAPLLTARSIREDEPARRVVLISIVCRGCTWMRRASAA